MKLVENGFMRDVVFKKLREQLSWDFNLLNTSKIPDN